MCKSMCEHDIFSAGCGGASGNWSEVEYANYIYMCVYDSCSLYCNT